ncbi:MAG: HD domain-containing protein [Spirochaetes bacterium]|nr:HD domain-containing protein [Spirochaetota bacterium]
MDIENAIRKRVTAIFTRTHASHDLEHTLRVCTLAVKIAKAEKASLSIVRAAALLHDIGRSIEDRAKGKHDHAVIGAKMADAILKKSGMPVEECEKVCACIRTHRFRGTNEKPSSIEAKVLFDADKLDAMGAVGIGRAFMFASEVGAKLHNHHIDIAHTKSYTVEDTAWREYMVKLRFLKDSMMTRTGRRLAQRRHVFMEKFFNEMNGECDGVW